MTYSVRDIDEWITTASMMFGSVPTDETFRSASEAAANLVSGSGFLGAPELFTQLIMVGYFQALQDVKNGDYDEDLQEWRPLKLSEDA